MCDTVLKETAEAAGSECVPWLYVADARHASEDVMLFPFFDKCKLNVQCDDAGIGSWLEWLWPVAEIALFEGEYCASPLTVSQHISAGLHGDGHTHAADQGYCLCRE